MGETERIASQDQGIRRNWGRAGGVPGGIRTHDPLLRRQPLYPLSYRDAV